MGYTTDLLTGLAELLDGEGIGAWKTDAAYTDAETGILLDVMPSTPDNVIVLSGYSVTDEPVYADTVTGVQIRTRTGTPDPRPTDDLADSIFDLLHGAQNLTLGGIRVQRVRRMSWTPLGDDQTRRHERSDNYYFDTWRPAPNRL